MSLRKLTLQRPAVKEDAVGFFRFGDIDQWKVLTNDAGEWHTLTTADFHKLLNGQIQEDHPEYVA